VFTSLTNYLSFKIQLFAYFLCKESEDEHEEEAAVAVDDDEPEPSMIQGTDALMTVVDMKDSSVAAVEDEAGENND